MLKFHALGPFQVVAGDSPLDLGGLRQQAVLARLLVARGRAVPMSVLIDELWPGDPPAQALSTIQGYVSRLRRALEPGRAPREEAEILVSAPPGYALRAGSDTVDTWLFESLVRAGETGDAAAVWDRMERALGLWRGPALAEFADLSWAAAEAMRLDELRLMAVEQRAEAALRLGMASATIPDLESHASAHPLREEAWRLLALALYRAGRQGDALGALRRARTLLREELGLDLGPTLQRLERDILAHAAHLDGPAPDAPDAAPAGVAAREASALRVVVADDQALVRAGLRVIMENEPGVELVGEAQDGEQAIALIRRTRPDLVLMDISMPRLDGLAAARRVLADAAPPKVVMMTTFGTDDNLYAALRAGVSGFVLKTSPPEQLLAALRAAADGDALIDPALTTRLIAAFAGRGDPDVPPALKGLTDADLDVIKLVARGQTNQEIATTLSVPEDSVGAAIASLLDRLALLDRAQLVVLAYESGLISPGTAR
ncbi:BTAD domain-containing putative transcriptional regulator [Sphaerisporangium sp. NPDC051011]|uniref:BTAD domain-containing putative transcriptional regulator n=1 Tax=Sphaerisporangium sp. NPDC051011 TaxID=3155792 RepID=UPI0033ED23F5